jgi:RNA polymerase sigma-70 factor (ECF subfamily)
MNLLDKRSNNELAAERELMQRCVEGDRQAFAIIYSHYAPLLYKVVYPLTNRSKEDTEEIIQELFVKIWDRRNNMLTIQSFRPFIFRLARNRVIDWYRKNESKKDYCTFYNENYPDEAISVTDDLLFEEYYAIAMEAIAKLPSRQKQIFNLRHTGDLSLSEIAGELRISIHAVKKQLYQATRFVKEYLQKHGEWLVSIPFLFFLGN